jgi:MFS family permease
VFNLNFLIILFIGFVDYLGIGLVYPIFAVMLFDISDPIMAAEMSAAYRGAMLGILIGLTPLSAFIFAPFLGSFSDSQGRKKTLIFGMGAGCLGYCLAVVGVLAHSLPLLFVFRILVGITEGSASVAQAAIADISTENNKARRFSLFSSSVGFGFTINEVGNYFAWGGLWYSLSSGLLTAPLSSRVSSEKLVLGSMVGCAVCMAIFSVIRNAHYIWLTLPVFNCCWRLREKAPTDF